MKVISLLILFWLQIFSWQRSGFLRQNGARNFNFIDFLFDKSANCHRVQTDDDLFIFSVVQVILCEFKWVHSYRFDTILGHCFFYQNSFSSGRLINVRLFLLWKYIRLLQFWTLGGPIELSNTRCKASLQTNFQVFTSSFIGENCNDAMDPQLIIRGRSYNT